MIVVRTVLFGELHNVVRGGATAGRVVGAHMDGVVRIGEELLQGVLCLLVSNYCLQLRRVLVP